MRPPEIGLDYLLVGSDFVRCSLGDQLAVIKSVDMVCQVHHYLHVMLDYEHGNSSVPDPANQLHELG